VRDLSKGVNPCCDWLFTSVVAIVVKRIEFGGFMTAEEFLEKYTFADHMAVRWGEMDALGHVNNAMFFRYFESVRMRYWEELMASMKGRVKPNIGPILASTQCRYKRPLYHPDQIIVGAKIESVQADRFFMGHAVWSEKQQVIVAEGEAVIVSFDYESKSKVPLPEAWKEFLT
jgi:acyl-CoA thioester hydrolase